MKFCNYKNNYMALILTPQEHEELQGHKLGERFALRTAGKLKFRIVPEGGGNKFFRDNDGMRFVIMRGSQTPEMRALPETGTIPVRGSISEAGVDFKIDLQQMKPVMKKKARNGKTTKRASTLNGSLRKDSGDELEDFRHAIRKVNELRRKTHASLSIERGDVVAELSVRQEVKLT